MTEKVKMKHCYYLAAFTICFTLLASGCDNDLAVERLYAPDADTPDWWSDDELWEETEDEDDDIPVPVKKLVSIDAVSGLILNSDDTKKNATVATLTLPLTFAVELPENIEDNALFAIQDNRQDTDPYPSILAPIANILASEGGGNDTGAVKIVINSEPSLEFGIYKVIIRIDPNDGINDPFTKKIEFTVAKTPPPFKTAPTVHPYITAPGKNKLKVSWNESPITATNFRVHVGTTLNNGQPYGELLGTSTRTMDITDIEDDSTYGGLPDGITYYVWLTAINNDGESPLGPPATRTTSATLWRDFYKNDGEVKDEGEREDFYCWDSFYGSGQPSGDYYIITPPSTEHPGGTLQYGIDGPGEIVYHATGRMRTASKWGEPLTDVNGVIIYKYPHTHSGNTSRGEAANRNYQGVYYYGLGSIQTKGPADGVVTGPNKNPLGLVECYFGNSYDLNGKYNPETENPEEAIDRFTLAKTGKFIAFIATPWYRDYTTERYDGWYLD
jgi:hypothetical protein